MPPKKSKHLSDGGVARKSVRTISVLPDPRYWRSLGEFIEKFATAEIMLFFYLSACAQIPHKMANIFFSGFHSDQLSAMTRKVWTVLVPDEEIQKIVDAALIHFKAITEVRNSVVHYGSYSDSLTGRISSNIARARSQKLINPLSVSRNNMVKIIADLEKINHHLTFAYLSTINPTISREELRSGFPGLDASWQYIIPEDHPRSSTRRERKSRNARPKSGSQPPPSQT
jgi:hypothetical protein